VSRQAIRASLIIAVALDRRAMIATRPFSPTDIPSVVKVVADSLGENYPPSLYLTVHNLWRDGFIMLLEDGNIVGFVAAVPSGTKVARVLMLAVLSRYRKRSFGQRLMNELYASCASAGIDTVILEVRKSNRIAISFYERQGFSFYGEIPKFYSNGEDAYKMMRVLRT
jgi:ribosomal-protein-alanine N-acetyltransferase